MSRKERGTLHHDETLKSSTKHKYNIGLGVSNDLRRFLPQARRRVTATQTPPVNGLPDEKSPMRSQHLSCQEIPGASTTLYDSSQRPTSPVHWIPKRRHRL
ncbi:hypothetical protein MTO96_004400 [Rhipicephalus appendiculatus]